MIGTGCMWHLHMYILYIHPNAESTYYLGYNTKPHHHDAKHENEYGYGYTES